MFYAISSGFSFQLLKACCAEEVISPLSWQVKWKEQHLLIKRLRYTSFGVKELQTLSVSYNLLSWPGERTSSFLGLS